MSRDRQLAIDLIDEAVTAGARCARACAVLEINVRTLQRWKKALQESTDLADRRKASAENRVSANKLSDGERKAILSVCNQTENQSLPPSQIVPRLADKGEYIASESSFYRVLRDAEQVHQQGRGSPPRSVPKPKGFKATGPTQLWSWDSVP
jgi:putative transposase